MSVSPDLRFEIEDLYARYVWAIAEGPLSDWGALFIEDGLYKVVSRENVERGWPIALILCENRAAIEDRIHAIEHLMMTVPRRVRQIVSGLRVTQEGAAWRVNAHFTAFETLAGQMTTVFAAGLHDDLVVRDAGALRFKQKISICDGDLIPNSLVMPL